MRRRTADPSGQALRLRPPLSPVVAVLLVAALALGSVGVDRGSETPVDLLLVGCPALLLVAVLVLPVLVVTDDHLDVVGVLRRHRVPWPQVEHVRQGWFLTLDLTDGRRVVALAAPVVSSMLSFRTLAEDEHHLLTRESATRAAFPGASASLAVELVSARRPPVRGGRDGGRGGGGDAVRTRWRPVVCGVVAGLVVAWAAALVLRLG